jgi:hypothetical protein
MSDNLLSSLHQEQGCYNCIFFIGKKVESADGVTKGHVYELDDRKFFIGKCDNDSSVWEGLERRSFEGNLCTDFSLIGVKDA